MRLKHHFNTSMIIRTKSRGETLMEAILNVEADRLAGDYQEHFVTYSLTMHMYPSSPSVLEINEMTITDNV